MVEYFQIPSGGKFPDVSTFKPYRAVVIIDEAVTKEWRLQAADWIALSGCMYMLAWGPDCSLWDDYVDEANVILAIDGHLPKNHFIISS